MTLAKTIPSQLQHTAPCWIRLDRLWIRTRRYIGLLLALVVLGTLVVSAEAARPKADLATVAMAGAQAVQETALDSELVREVDLRWLDGARADLRGLTLEGATLTGADLSHANLSGVDLAGATLLGTHLSKANLSEAVLRRADLHYAILTGADLRGADLRGANLQWIDLQDADLRGARLDYARLHWAYLYGATLPDGTRWRPGVDTDRFTDPAHPAFWVQRYVPAGPARIASAVR